MSNSNIPKTQAWITFAGTFDNNVADRFFRAFPDLICSGITDLHLLIQSAGGIIGDGVAVYNYLRALPVNLTTYNAGAVESIALLPYLAGHKRRASKASTFLIHKAMMPLAGPTGALELSAKAEAARLYDSQIEGILRSEISLPDDKWAAHNVSDVVFGAEDAVSYGVVHEVADFRPPRGSVMLPI